MNNAVVSARRATTHPDKSGISVVQITFVLSTLLTPRTLIARSADPISVGDRDLFVLIKRCREGLPEPVLVLRFHAVPSMQAGLDSVHPRGIQGGLATATRDFAVKGDSFIWNYAVFRPAKNAREMSTHNHCAAQVPASSSPVSSVTSLSWKCCRSSRYS